MSVMDDSVCGDKKCAHTAIEARNAKWSRVVILYKPPGQLTIGVMRHCLPFRGLMCQASLLLLFTYLAFGADGTRKNTPTPDALVIGRHTFFDFGPPFNYYEVIVLQRKGAATTVQRVLATPAVDACVQPAKVEVAEALVPESLELLLEQKNPCQFSEKALKKERSRRKKGLVFSGAEVSIALECDNQKQTVRADVLDRDMFDSHVNTPENTSWTMRLLERVDQALGGGVWDKPIFAATEEPPTQESGAAILEALASGEYDALFSGTPDKVSDLYRQSQAKSPQPQVALVQSAPVQPERFVPPLYPPIARAAHIEGTVAINFRPDAEGRPRELVFESAHPMLKGSVEKAAAEWVFPPSSAGQLIRATLQFKLNCPALSKHD